MENLAIIESFGEFKDEKSIDRVTLMSFIEEAFRVQIRKKYGTDENFDVIVNPDKGDLEIWRNRTIVADGAVEDDNLEIALAAAIKIEPDFEVGEEVSEEIKIIDLGRRFILAFRQTLVQKVQEHDSGELFKRYKTMEGEIISGEVHHVRHRELIIYDDQQNELILRREDMIPEKDFYRKGDTVRAVVKLVEVRGAKPFILLSRTSEEFMAKLFEAEIPEVLDGIITVKKVVRIPGEKAKVAVESYDDRVDPVGACVGMKGSRIHGIVRELRGENIDVINYTNNLQLMIQRALSPAKITNMVLDEERRHVDVYLPADQVSLAIGRGGTNIRLASKLNDYEIDVYREDVVHEEDVELLEFSDEIEAWVIEQLRNGGYDTAKSVLRADIEDVARRADLEVETVQDVRNILTKEFDAE
ncbi:MAG: transcription elongation factor NusA [Cryomorphaceae bacterium BACL18 MAG-120924-bin36]|jgi:transcription termination/antitermination protein NusA|nr:MAG: transcription elongation factor NusA [Cryomorphaceae bacterium BACL18 MAG-120924-bin36]MDP4730097.1 transcription termination factor NusA [Schleiferiaceae bacterium]MDP5015611.1 transcription termination factor NusA [Schleiferiaceae bacterium]HAG34623.1 transcription termination/antitermination protein NusA [Cryomorphaceae bacterium]